MREILFRGKRIKSGEWIEGFYFEKQNPCSKDGTPIRYCISDLPPFGAEIIPETVGQFTGLTDKNGTKIFEGDIVIHCNENPHGDIEKGQVYWDEDFCGWRRTSNGAFNHGKIDTYRIAPNCVYEVIGNIHDNPELLEGATE